MVENIVRMVIEPLIGLASGLSVEVAGGHVGLERACLVDCIVHYCKVVRFPAAVALVVLLGGLRVEIKA